MIISPNAFLTLGIRMTSKLPTHTINKTADIDFFKRTFGVSHIVCAHTWEYITTYKTKPKKAMPRHLLWTLIMMSTYSTETFLSRIVGTTEKTFRKWVWLMKESISNIYSRVIKFRNRLIYDGDNNWSTMTVDGTDFRIVEPTPFSRSWYSHKFKSAGLRYEVAMSINGGDIVWTNGPFPCGSWPDVSIFRSGLKEKLRHLEFLEADKGYAGEIDTIRLPNQFGSDIEKRNKQLARARHETVNRRFKQFKILKHEFRHNLQKHQIVFRAVVVLTQLSIQNGEVLFACDFE